MCGILGRIDRNLINISTFRLQLQQINHRGPDGNGVKLLCDGKIALGHKRLSIIDLTESGAQPMCNEDESIWITFNGEIYNYLALKNELIVSNHIFHSNSDTEVLIHGYEEWGIDGLVKRLNGMFAFAIWDDHKKKLFAARDRFGIKPFYYAHSTTLGYSFASELKALVAAPDFDNAIDFNAMADFLVYRFIPAPNTIYKSTKKLLPGHFSEYDYSSGDLKIECFWKAEDYVGQEKYTDYAESIENTLSKSVVDHLISDVPVGVFLSGGYDSSALVHYMKKSTPQFSTFSIGFKDWPNSEHEDAKIVAELYKTDHREQILDGSMQDDLSNYAYYYDEPLGGSSFMPTFKVAQMTAKTHKVVLGGDGGDELFGGYKWYYKVLVQRQSGKGRLKKLFGHRDDLLELYHASMSWSGYDYKEANLLINAGIEEKENIWLYKKYDSPTASDLKRLQLIDINTFLPDVINTKVDRASMASSLEVRVPFLNHELAEKMLALNEGLYYEAGVNKKLLKSFLAPHLPKQILDKKKQGFGAPVTYNKDFEALKDGLLVKDGLLNSQMVENYIKQKNRAKLWPILILENWYKRWHS